MNAIALCFFCALARSTHDIEHSLLGPKPVCDGCDPNPRTSVLAADTLQRMTGCIVAGVQIGAVGLGDEWTTFDHLTASGFSGEAIELFLERATEAARRQLQRVENRYSPFAHAAEAASLLLILVAWGAGFCLLNPPTPQASHAIHFAQVH